MYFEARLSGELSSYRLFSVPTVGRISFHHLTILYSIAAKSCIYLSSLEQTYKSFFLLSLSTLLLRENFCFYLSSVTIGL